MSPHGMLAAGGAGAGSCLNECFTHGKEERSLRLPSPPRVVVAHHDGAHRLQGLLQLSGETRLDGSGGEVAQLVQGG